MFRRKSINLFRKYVHLSGYERVLTIRSKGRKEGGGGGGRGMAKWARIMATGRSITLAWYNASGHVTSRDSNSLRV